MRSYALHYVNSAEQAKIVHFTADDSGDAWSIARELASDQPADLWDGGYRIARLNRTTR